ncbi:kinase [Streptococcus pseudoporcinus]|uniref:Streptokinase n=1 Tax=Streptococcus pseudoporcinus TaxID=361101 RepID=A0A4V6KZH9_9STRE|nr:kinase [Streptococcus pseudoporcinus]VTS12957.1 streptokinase [Streptococcus pseudoporcinus]VUC66112.1 streptokinase [Streptococcus pseudoporcinus]VUC97039.1 streptokinase [Streptococcus pseudoporcinus]VUC97427.1 streptokinase [Streptococcus pseudoporcinus]
MKKYSALLGGILICAALFMQAHTVHASASEYLDELADLLRPRSHPLISISVVGVDKDTKREFYIQGLDFEVTSSKVTKKELLDAINSKYLHSRMDNQTLVLDFQTDAKLTGQDGKVLEAQSDGSVMLPKNANLHYRLSGHVTVGRAPILPIKNPVDRILVRRHFTFKPLNSDGKMLESELAIPDVKEVNSVLTVANLKQSAEEVLNKLDPAYTILEVDDISVKHDDRTFTTIDDANNPESSYTVKAREHKPFDSGDDELLSGNQDTIKETYTIIRKDYLDDKGNLKYDLIDVHYIDASNNHLLLKQTYRLMPYEKHRIDFSNPYDYQSRHKILRASLDDDGVSGYTLTGRVDQVTVDGSKRVNVYMVRRDPSLRPFDHAGYDNGASHTEDLEYSYLRELGVPQHEDAKFEPLIIKPK